MLLGKDGPVDVRPDGDRESKESKEMGPSLSIFGVSP